MLLNVPKRSTIDIVIKDTLKDSRVTVQILERSNTLKVEMLNINGEYLPILRFAVTS